MGIEVAFWHFLMESWTFGSGEIPTQTRTAASSATQCPPGYTRLPMLPVPPAHWGAGDTGGSSARRGWRLGAFLHRDTGPEWWHWGPWEGKEPSHLRCWPRCSFSPSCWTNSSASPQMKSCSLAGTFAGRNFPGQRKRKGWIYPSHGGGGMRCGQEVGPRVAVPRVPSRSHSCPE